MFRSRWLKLVSLVLVGSFAFPPSVWAQAKPTVVVPPLPGLASDRARSGLATALRATGRVNVVETSAVDSYLKDRQATVPTPTKKDSQAISKLKEGTAAYRDLEIDQSISLLTKAKAGFRGNLLEDGAFENLRAAQIYLAMAHLAKKERGRAKEELKGALILDPDRKTRKLPEKFYPPDVRKLYEETRTEVLSKEKGDLEILSRSQGELVYVDGKSAGTTPARVLDLPVGEHFIRVESEGKEPYFNSQNIVSGENRLNVELKSLKRVDPDLFFGTVKATADVDHERAAFLDGMGLALSADIFVFLGAEEASVRAQLYDQRSQEVSPIARAKSPEALASELIHYIDRDGYVTAQAAATPKNPLTSSAVKPDSQIPERYQPKEPTSLSEQMTKPLADTKNPQTDVAPWYQNRWIWIAAGSVLLIGGGAVFLFTDIGKQKATTSTLTFTVPAK